MDEPTTKPIIWQASSLVDKPNVKPNTGSSSSLVANDGSITIQDVVCKPHEKNGMTVMDLRPAGVLKEAFPIELLKNPEKSKVLLCHENVLSFLESTIDSLPPNITIEIFDYCGRNHLYAQKVGDKYLWKTCYIALDQHGLIFLDLKCKALRGQPLKFSTKKKLHQVILRDYEEGVLVCDRSGTFESLEELIIADGEPGERTITIKTYHSSFGKFPQISLSSVNVIPSPGRPTHVQFRGECKKPFLGEMVNLKKLFLSAGGTTMSLTGMDKLPNIVEVTVIDNLLDCNADFFQNMTKVKKLTLVNCGLPAELGECSELQELKLHNNFHSRGDNPTVFPKLPHLKKLDLSNYDLKQLPDGLGECSELQELNLHNSFHYCDSPIVFPKLPHLKKLDLSNCGLKQLPDGLGECSELQELNLHDSFHFGDSPIVFPKLPHLKKLDLSNCGLRQLPDGLGECSELHELDLHNSYELGPNLTLFPKLETLQRLDLSLCNLRELPVGLRECCELKGLVVSSHLVDAQLLSAFKLQKLVGPLFGCYIYTRRSEEVLTEEERWVFLKWLQILEGGRRETKIEEFLKEFEVFEKEFKEFDMKEFSIDDDDLRWTYEHLKRDYEEVKLSE